MRLIRRLWTEENVTFEGEHFKVTDSTVQPRLPARGARKHPRLYFGGASEAAERVSATEADVQLFWGEPLAGVQERIERLKALSKQLDRDLPPLEFGLRITTFAAIPQSRLGRMRKPGWQTWPRRPRTRITAAGWRWDNKGF